MSSWTYLANATNGKDIPKRKPPVHGNNVGVKKISATATAFSAAYGSLSDNSMHGSDNYDSGSDATQLASHDHHDHSIKRESIRTSIADWERHRHTAAQNTPDSSHHRTDQNKVIRKKSVEWAKDHSFEKPNAAFYSAVDSRGRIEEYLKNPIQAEYVDVIKTQFFSLGIASGASLQLFLVSFLLMFASASKEAGPMRELGHEYYPVFRGVLLISFFFSMYGANMFIWRRANVDYASVLGVTYAHTYQYVLRGSSSTAYITFSMFMLYFLTITGNSDFTDRLNSGSELRHIWPALSIIVPLLLFCFPFDQFTILCFGVQRNGFKQRFALLKDIAMVLISPFSEVTFMRGFIGDVFCSMPRVFTDMQYTICIYVTGAAFMRSPDDLGPYDLKPHAYYTCGAGNRRYYMLQILLGFLPYFIRFCQCTRAYHDTGLVKHIFNALKYALSLGVTGLAFTRTAAAAGAWPPQIITIGHTVITITDPAQTLDYSWIVLSVVATCYSFYWDVVMDWGLGNTDCTYFGLRSDLSFFPDKYYIAVVLDFFMRLGWAFVISPDQRYVAENYMLLLGAIELTRRALWAIFRVEWEYVHQKALKRSKMVPKSHFPTVNVPAGPRRHSEYTQHHFAAEEYRSDHDHSTKSEDVDSSDLEMAARHTLEGARHNGHTRSTTGTRLEDTVAATHTGRNETHNTGTPHGQHFRYRQTPLQSEEEDEGEKVVGHVPFSTDSSSHSYMSSDGNTTD